MTFADALDAWLTHHKLDDEVGAALMEGMKFIARKQKVKRRHQEDAAMGTLNFLLRKGADITGQSAGERINYLSKVMDSHAKRLRRAEREVLSDQPKDMEDTSESEGVSPVELVGAQDDRQVRAELVEEQELLQRLLRSVVEAQPERYRERLYKDWVEIEELWRGEIEVDDLLASALGPNWRSLPAKEVEQARDLMQQRHSRIRRRLRDEVEAGVKKGTYSLEEQEVALAGLRSRVLRQQSAPRSSDPGEGR